MSELALHFLGPPRVELDGAAITVDRRKALALLAYLALTGRAHSRDALATLFWPEHDQRKARAGLRSALASLKSALRQAQDVALGEGWADTAHPLDIDRETIGLNPDAQVWLDVTEFQARLAQTRTHAHPPGQTCPDCLSALAEAAELY
ncbi:MAG: hypothetical protein GY824_23770, partial [Delftia sp.]|nr:hypothetical protein [Delftia sp.]